MPSVSQLDEDEIPTAKTCNECRGEGRVTLEDGTRYTVATCRWCMGSGRVPMASGTMERVRK